MHPDYPAIFNSNVPDRIKLQLADVDPKTEEGQKLIQAFPHFFSPTPRPFEIH